MKNRSSDSTNVTIHFYDKKEYLCSWMTPHVPRIGEMISFNNVGYSILKVVWMNVDYIYIFVKEEVRKVTE
jgi:hypothetical protein